ncbi:hypothetical protein ACFX5Q_07360 [Mesorhizobium sp. IMUNJ 23033]|uniref:hypothetical protein n=1 Tax=Mesorhizobium sp. IMUNJ 23033 TaxID=3378039 RepID=UPI00384D67DD
MTRNRFLDQGDMTADQVIETSYDLLAILQLVKTAADAAAGYSMSPEVSASIARGLALAVELHAPLHDALETHVGAKSA